MKSVLKHIGIIRNNFSTFGAYSKLRVQRGPKHICSLFISNDATVQQFKKQVEAVFKGQQIQLVEHKTPHTYLKRIGLMQSSQQKVVQTEQQPFSIKDQPLIQSLMSDYFSLVQNIPNSNEKITYGIQISRLSQTNNLNLPDYIAQGIVDLNSQWAQTQTAQSVLNVASFQRQEITTVQQRKMIAYEYQQAIKQLIILSKFQNSLFLNRGRSKREMQFVTSIKIINFLFLFGITYGKYGWDLGEPTAYLTSLATQLIAMLGLYQYQESVQTKGIYEKNLYLALHNIPSRQKMIKFRLSQYQKKL